VNEEKETKVIITLNNMNDEAKLFMYFNTLKIRSYATLLCICVNYKIFVFPAKVYHLLSFSNNT
jgi:hypothetical protein